MAAIAMARQLGAGTFYTMCVDTDTQLSMCLWRLRGPNEHSHAWPKGKAAKPAPVRRKTSGILFAHEDGVGALDPGAIDHVFITPLVQDTLAIRQAGGASWNLWQGTTSKVFGGHRSTPK